MLFVPEVIPPAGVDPQVIQAVAAAAGVAAEAAEEAEAAAWVAAAAAGGRELQEPQVRGLNSQAQAQVHQDLHL